jgi:membrane protease YdiL (CAAX protease family)
MIVNQPTTATTRAFAQLRSIVIGTGGIRAGWRLLLFVLIFAVVALAIHTAANPFIPHTLHAPKVLLPTMIAVQEVALITCTVLATLVMGKIERRSFDRFGLPMKQALHARFWSGALMGFAAISAVLLATFTLGGFRILGIATHGWALVNATLIWSATALLIGMSEEFLFRGYPQFTLATGMGFWPAALLLSLGFGAAHLLDRHESATGIASVVAFALLACLMLQRTGNLWLAIGFHASWDWGESFFYGVPDSGLKSWHSFLASQAHGPIWLTGGRVGPEGSVFTFLTLALVAILVCVRWPTNQYSTAAFPAGAGPAPSRV